jgi:hypothetical protein
MVKVSKIIIEKHTFANQFKNPTKEQINDIKKCKEAGWENGLQLEL